MKDFINASGNMLISTLRLTTYHKIKGTTKAYYWNGFYDLNAGLLSKIKMIFQNGTRN